MAHTPDIVPWDEFSYSEDSDDTYILLAEGDSWFTLGGIPTSNLLFSLRFDWPALIVNCALPGDTLKHMSQIANNRALRQALSEHNGYPWNAILLSGGGNDLIDMADEILLPPNRRAGLDRAAPEDYCDLQELDRLIESVRAGYRRLVELRDRPGGSARLVPMIVHTYDYIVPRDSPARFFGVSATGPWLYKAMRDARIPEQDWQPVSDYLIEALRDGIFSLQASEGGELEHFHVVDTLGTLEPADSRANGNSNDWLNEIHPNHHGYAKLAARIERKLDDVLPGGSGSQ